MFRALAEPHAGVTLSVAAISDEEGVVELASHYAMSFRRSRSTSRFLERAGLITKERIRRRKVSAPTSRRCCVARHLLDQYEELWRGRIDRMNELIARWSAPSTPWRQRRANDDRPSVRKDPRGSP